MTGKELPKKHGQFRSKKKLSNARQSRKPAKSSKNNTEQKKVKCAKTNWVNRLTSVRKRGTEFSHFGNPWGSIQEKYVQMDEDPGLWRWPSSTVVGPHHSHSQTCSVTNKSTRYPQCWIVSNGILEKKQEQEYADASVNFSASLKEESITFLDFCILTFEKLSSVFGRNPDYYNRVSQELLKKQFLLMSNFDSVIKDFSEKVGVCQPNHFKVPSVLQFMNINIHYLLALRRAADQEIKAFEKEVAIITGERLGRDKNPKFANFVNFSESSVERYIHMACDILNSYSGQKYGCKKEWSAFCEVNGKTSKVISARSNRFVHFFEGAAALMHHYVDIATFFTESYNSGTRNVIQESVQDDLFDETLQSLLCVLALVYLKVIGPYWQLLTSKAKYIDFRKYVQSLYQKLYEWSSDATPLLFKKFTDDNVFHRFLFPEEEHYYGVFSFCNPKNQYFPFIAKCLERVMKSFVSVTVKYLADFLPGGIYDHEPSTDACAKLKFCQLQHLMGNYPYGHHYSDTYRMPPNSKLQRNCYTSCMENSQVLNCKVLPQEFQNSAMIVSTVVSNGGPCKTKRDVDNLLFRLEGASLAKKLEAIQMQINYQKNILGVTDTNFSHIGLSLKDMVEKLKMVLADEDYTHTADRKERYSSDYQQAPRLQHWEVNAASTMLGSYDDDCLDDNSIYVNMAQCAVQAFENQDDEFCIS
ncbi:solute carrier family 52, riboflavin transporter, member 2 isoform X1 [Erpetoichthys calabaricus]|uniref:Uncharacterized protein n=1 Tax=Erpetoichthys calabaricus TaxID=27687 RepID=A0A8C4SP30_ERPCA|nr:solute carrier family 52, riboflavin transporter, member 2 isoform X1 [Erpetoichthys calabaricus]XP_028673852.1 solute carrier family 52, riboflavin transporter, member 2 isoform X1 [Erpetoichthys calabaricus]